MAKLHKMVSATELCADYNMIIGEFIIDWTELNEQFGLSFTLKIHIISDHLGDRLSTTGETLLKESNEHVEKAHHRVFEFGNIHQYQTSIRQLGTPNQGKKQHSMVVHLNSGNI